MSLTVQILVLLLVGELWSLWNLRRPAMLRRGRFQRIGFRTLPYVIGLWGGAFLLIPSLRIDPLYERWGGSLLIVIFAGVWLTGTLEAFTTPTSVGRRVYLATLPVLAIVWFLFLRSL